MVTLIVMEKGTFLPKGKFPGGKKHPTCTSIKLVIFPALYDGVLVKRVWA